VQVVIKQGGKKNEKHIDLVIGSLIRKLMKCAQCKQSCSQSNEKVTKNKKSNHNKNFS